MFKPYLRFHTVLTFNGTEQLQLHVTNSDKFSFHFFLTCWWYLMKWMSPSTAHHFLGSCSLFPPGKRAGKCHLRLNPTPYSGMRRLLGPKLRWVQLNRELFLIVLAGHFQRLKFHIRMSPWRGSGRASIDQEDEARCLHYSWPGEGSGYIKEGVPHTAPCYPWTQYLGPPVTSLP